MAKSDKSISHLLFGRLVICGQRGSVVDWTCLDVWSDKEGAEDGIRAGAGNIFVRKRVKV